MSEKECKFVIKKGRCYLSSIELCSEYFTYSFSRRNEHPIVFDTFEMANFTRNFLINCLDETLTNELSVLVYHLQEVSGDFS